MVHGGLAAIKAKFGVATATIKKWAARYRAQEAAGVLIPDISVQRMGRCGRKTKLTDALREDYRVIMEKYVNDHMTLTDRTLKDELAALGTIIARATIQSHLRTLKAGLTL